MTRSQGLARRAAVVLCAAAALMGPGDLAGASAGTAAVGLSPRPGALIYITNLHSDTVSVVDTVSNFDSDTLSVIDTSTARVTHTVTVGDGPTGVAAAPGEPGTARGPNTP